MKAATNTEVYRRFEGQLATRRFRFLPLARTGIKTAAKKKLPLVLLLAPPGIATIIFSFVVYARFSLESGLTPTALGGQGGPANPFGAMLMNDMGKQLLDARNTIVGFHLGTDLFAILLMAWYGAGLIAEDRRLGAHLLYFARPITRLDYVVAKLLVVAFFGALGTLVPGLVICTVATFSSHEWSFFTQEWDVIVWTVVFGILWTLSASSLVLAVSSLSTRRAFALVGVFGYFLLASAMANLLWHLQNEPAFQALSLGLSLKRIAAWMFDIKHVGPEWSLTLAFTSVAALIVVAWTIVWTRVKRLEVVA